MVPVRFARLRHEEGFTLVELMVGMVITVLLMGSIAAALIVGLKTTDETTARLNESHDAQISSAYLANDVQSASSVSVPGGGGGCGSATTLATFTYPSGQIATYACGQTGAETQVTRTFDGDTVVLAHFAGSAQPTVTCTPDCSTTPLRVDIAFTESSGYSFTLVGSERRSNANTIPPGEGTTAEFTLFVLGAGSANAPLWVSGGCPKGQINNPGLPEEEQCTEDTEVGQITRPHLTVKGNLYVNVAMNGAVRLSGLRSQEKLRIDNGDFKILQGGTCQGCTVKTVICPACTTFPYGSYSPALLDPLRFMSPPPPGPGVYVHTSTLSINGTTVLPAGIHILQAGMNVNGNANVTVSDPSVGIMFYNEGGSINFAGGSRFDLPAYKLDPYKNILIFQARGNTNDLSLGGSTSVSSNLGGIIYAPNASRVVLGSGGAYLAVTAVIAQGIKVIGDTEVIIGPPVTVSIPAP